MTSAALSRPDNPQKQQVWAAYHARHPTRVPMRFSSNPRVFILNPAWNTQGYTFQQAAEDAETHVKVCLGYLLYGRSVLNRYCDAPVGPPEVWDVSLCGYNVYEAGYFGAAVQYPPGQVPCTEPILTEDNKESVFAIDIERPLENPFFRGRLAFWKEMEKVCQGLQFEGRPVRLQPWAVTATDGPVTVGCNLRGSEFLVDLVAEPEYADRLMRRVIHAAIIRRRTFHDYWGPRIGAWNGMADDSVALLSESMYRQRVLPLHRLFYEAADPKLGRSMHLCGDATRHFPAIHRELGVTSFDTGFPVDFASLRRQLGPDVEISGGVEVSLLLHGTAEQVYARSREILTSGIKEGGRFIFQEANNLPPNVPEANLEAMYQACLDFGGY